MRVRTTGTAGSPPALERGLANVCTADIGKPAEKSAFDFNVLMRRREVAAILLAQGEDERYCAAWEAHGYVSRSNVAGTRKAYDEFNEKAQEVLDSFEVARLPREESPEKVYTLANLASLCNKKKQK